MPLAYDRQFCRNQVCLEQWVILQSWFLVWFLVWKWVNDAIFILRFHLKIYPFCTSCCAYPSHTITDFYLGCCFLKMHCSPFQILCSDFHFQFFSFIFLFHLFSFEAELLYVFNLVREEQHDLFIRFMEPRSWFCFLQWVFNFGIKLYFYTFLLVHLMLWKFLA